MELSPAELSALTHTDPGELLPRRHWHTASLPALALPSGNTPGPFGTGQGKAPCSADAVPECTKVCKLRSEEDRSALRMTANVATIHTL